MHRVAETTAVRHPAVRPPAAVPMCCGFVSVPVWSMATTAASWQSTAHRVAYEQAARTVRARERWAAAVTPSRN